MTDDLNMLIPEWMNTFNVASASVIITQDKAIRYQGAFGEVTLDTVMSAQSLTKPMVAYRALQMVAAGDLILDRPLRKYLAASYAPNDPRVDTITARHALAHTSGLPNWRLFDETTELRTAFAPSTDFTYSGEGYCYLQTAMEAITGETLDVLLQPLFDHFGMSASYIHILTDREREHPVLASLPHLSTNAAFGLMTSANDYTKFMLAMLDEDIRLMLQKQHGVGGKPNLGWGLGWGIEDTVDGRYFWQWGSGMGKRHLAIGSIDTRWTALIMTDGDQAPDTGLQLANAIIQHEKPTLGTWFAWLSN